ncbi:MAG: DNA polymerase III subunit gamma/tau C-terminal domain-containing protein, partial [Pseudomonadota bacterium]
IKLLAHAADGSMRDGLSLLDQAIAYGGGNIQEDDVRAMLGTIDQDYIGRLLQGLAVGDAQTLLQTVADVTEQVLYYETLLEELLLALLRIALGQADPALAGEDGESFLAHARTMTPQDVQLYYQIGIMGRRDLPYAPDMRSGIEMTLLRMIAFRPAEAGEPRAVVRTESKPQTTAPKIQTAPMPAPAPALAVAPSRSIAPANTKWNEIVAQLKIAGLLRELANNTTLESYENGAMTLVLDESRVQLLNKEREAELKSALENYYGQATKLIIRHGRPPVETPAMEKVRVQDERQQAAVQAITDDPNVRALQEKFSARVNPGSIRPKV